MLVKETTEQFLSLAQQIYINGQGEMDASELLEQTIGQQYGDIGKSHPEDITYRLVKNSVAARLDKIQRKQASDLEKWVSVGQMDCFGSGEFKIPSVLLPKSISAAENYMRDKADQEQEHADELAKQWNAQVQKAKNIAIWAEEISKLRQGVLYAGMNPEEVSVEQAIQTAKQNASEFAPAFSAAAEGTMRDLRPDA